MIDSEAFLNEVLSQDTRRHVIPPATVHDDSKSSPSIVFDPKKSTSHPDPSSPPVPSRRRSRSPSLSRSRRTRSPSPNRSRRARSPSPSRSRRVRSPSPSRSRRPRSPSPSRSRRPRSPSPLRNRRPRSPSPRGRRYRSPPPSRRRNNIHSHHQDDLVKLDRPVDRPMPVDESPSGRLDRTICATQLAARMRSKELMEFFQRRVGGVREVRIVKDQRTGVSKGIAYVEFWDVESVDSACDLSGERLMGAQLQIQRTESEKKLLSLQQNLDVNANSTIEPTSRKIFLAGVHPGLGEDDIKLVFEPFGAVEFVQLQKDSKTNESKGFAIICFRRAPDAKQAVDQMNNFELAGRKIRVGFVADGKTAAGAAGSVGNMNGSNGDAEKSIGEKDRLVDDGETGLGQVSRAELMSKLARDSMSARDSVSPPVRSRNLPSTISSMKVDRDLHSNVPSMPPTRNCVLKNLFNPLEETDPDWVVDIRDAVVEECEKFGRVAHINIDQESQDGICYLRFDSVSACEGVVKLMDGRWFARRQVKALYIADVIYFAQFPEAGSQ